MGWGRGGRVGRRLSPMARPGPESRAGSGTSARTQGPGRHGPLWSLGSLVKVGHTCLPPTLLAPCAVFKQTTSQKKKQPESWASKACAWLRPEAAWCPAQAGRSGALCFHSQLSLQSVKCHIRCRRKACNHRRFWGGRRQS